MTESSNTILFACRKCGIEKPHTADHFVTRAANAGRKVTNQCRVCNAAACRAYNLNNKEKLREYERTTRKETRYAGSDYYKEKYAGLDKEKAREGNKRWHLENPGKSRAIEVARNKRVREQAKGDPEFREKLRKKSRDWTRNKRRTCPDFREKAYAATREWRSENKEWGREYARKRRDGKTEKSLEYQEYQREYQAEHYQKNKAARSAKAQTPEYKAMMKAWYARNKDRVNADRRSSYAESPEAKRDHAKKWADANPETLRETRRRCYEKRKKRPEVRISANISSRILQSLKGSTKQGKKTWKDLGYSRAQLMLHLEKQFTKGMTWENYGDWHIDHIIPLSAVNFQSMDHIDFKRAWSLKNLQPLWAADNFKKNAKLDGPFQPSLAI